MLCLEFRWLALPAKASPCVVGLALLGCHDGRGPDRPDVGHVVRDVREQCRVVLAIPRHVDLRPLQTRVLGVGLEQRAVAQLVRSAHIEMTRGTDVLERTGQRLQHVDDRYRLHQGGYPRWHGVHGHPFADLPDDLERGGPAPREQRCAQHHDGRGYVAEDLLDLTSRLDVLGELGLVDVGDESGEVDDPVDAVGSCRLGEVGGCLAVGVGEVVAAHANSSTEASAGLCRRAPRDLSCERL